MNNKNKNIQNYNPESIRNVLDAKNISAAFYKMTDSNPDGICCSQAIVTKNEDPETIRAKSTLTNSQVESQVNKLANYLISIGVKPEDKVAIISSSRPEWMIADLAIMACSAVSVSVYQSLPSEDIAYILFDSGADVVMIENQEQLKKINKIINQESEIPATEDRESTKVKIKIKAAVSFEQIEETDYATTLETILNDSKIENKRPEQRHSSNLDSLSALVYTSGTTGPPKGVMQTHGNHLANVRQTYTCKMINAEHDICLILPLAHSFAKLIGYLGFITPIVIRFAGVVDKKTSKMEPKSATKDIRESGSNIFPVVPRLLEKMQNGVMQATKQPGLKGKLISTTIAAAEKVYKKDASFKDELIFKLTKALRKKISKQLFGDNFFYALSGGAKLPTTVANFFYALEIPIIEGYGLTETCVAVNVGRHDTPIGSVGPVLANDIEVKIAKDGEIKYRGPNVAIGYYNRPTATSKSWDKDRWFHTGDLGSIDNKGNLSIVGRKKEIIVTSGGKKVAPHDIETEIKTHPLISQAVLCGDGRKYCVAILTLNQEEIDTWVKTKKLSTVNSTASNSNEELRKIIKSHIKKVNSELASFETIKNFFLTKEDFSVDNGYLTPTFKIKRALVEKNFKDEIDKMY